MLTQDFEELYTMISSESPPLNAADDIHQKVCCQVHQRKHVTPYIHAMVYHVPNIIRQHGSMKQFSCQGKLYTCKRQIFFSGVEKHNDGAKRNYFSSN